MIQYGYRNGVMDMGKYKELFKKDLEHELLSKVDEKHLKMALKNRKKWGEDERGSEGLWDLSYEMVVDYASVHIHELNDEEYEQYHWLANALYDLLVEKYES